MNSHLRYSLKYFNYLFNSCFKFSSKLNKSFIADFKSGILSANRINSDLSTIYSIIQACRNSNRIISCQEIGAGSNFRKNKSLSLKNIIKNSSIPKKYGVLLYSIIQHFNLKERLEIGTSVGISSLYICQAQKTGCFTSLEGVKEKQDVAKEIVSKLNKKTNFVLGNFDDTLPIILKNINKLDFVFFDGNHTKSATIKYFNLCLEKINSNTVFVFDDIYWSKEMEEAWLEIKNHSKVILSIDLFRLGLIFFNKELSKEHYTILY